MARARCVEYVAIVAIALCNMGFRAPVETPPAHRYVSLARGEVNMREGPSFDHKVMWVYHREGLPMQVLAQYDIWRRVRDSDGTVGWIQSSMLSAARTIVVAGEKPAPIRDANRINAHVSAYMAPGVVARVQTCAIQFCEVVTAGAVGWVNKKFIWGVDKGETF